MSLWRTTLELPVRRPGAVLIATLLVTLGFGAGLTRLEVDASIESMIVEGDSDRIAFDEKKAVFGSDEVVAIAIQFEDALAPEALDVQQRIVRRLERIPEIADIDSLVTTDDILGRDEILDVQPLVPGNAATWDSERIAHIRQRVETNELWTGFLISRDGRTAAIQVHLDDPARTGTDRGALMSAIEAAVNAERGERPFHLAGHPFMKTEIARTMRRDVGIFLPVTILAMTAFLVICIGSLRVAFLMLGGVLCALVWMMGIMGWIGQPLTALSNTAPTILLALGTAYLMHLVASYQRAVVAGGSSAEIVRRALDRVRKPTFIAGVTTAIGFSFVATSRVPLVQGFGIDLAAGILAVVVVACFSVPAALTFLTPTPGRGILANERRLGTGLFYVARLASLRPATILSTAVLLFALAILASTQLKVDSSGPNAFAEDSRFRQSSEFYRANLSGDVIENVYLVAPNGGFKEPERLRRMLAFQAEVEKLPEIDKTISIANYIRLMNRAMYANDPAEERIPDTREAVAQYLLLYDSSGDPDEFSDLVDEFYDEARIVLKATVLSSSESAALRDKLSALAAVHLRAESNEDSVLSTEILLSQAADTLAIEQARSLAGALLTILLVVTLAFRSLRAGAVLGLPNGLPVALNFGIMALVGISLREATAVIAVTALGIAVDSTVHLLEAIRVSEKNHCSRRAAVLEAMLTTGRPVFVTSLIIVAGFAVLLLSDFRVISDFGGLTALAIFFALLGDLLVLPAQLLISTGSRDGSSKTGGNEDNPLLVATGDAVFAGITLQRSGNELAIRPLGEVPRWGDVGDDPVVLHTLEQAERIEGRLEHADREALRIRLEGEETAPAPSSRPVQLPPGIAQLFREPIAPEFEYGGFRFRRAETQEEREQAYRLRYGVFAREGFIDAADFPHGLFRDANDEYAVQLLVYTAAGELVGSTRLVLPSQLGFSTEDVFDLPPVDVPRERIGEVGRLALRPDYRGGERIPMVGLIKMIYDGVREYDLSHVVAFMPPDLIASLASLGCVARTLETQPPSPKTLGNRELMRGYFEQLEATPVLFSLEEFKRIFGL